MRARKGLVLRVCLEVSCGPTHRPLALDPPLGAIYDWTEKVEFEVEFTVIGLANDVGAAT